jgi:hypothetical protein
MLFSAQTGPGWSILAVHERRAHPLSTNGGLPFLAFSCFCRRTYLPTVAAMELFEDALERVRLRYTHNYAYILPGLRRMTHIFCKKYAE